MSSWQLGLDLVLTFVVAAGLLFHYGNWYRHHIFVTLSVLVAWYFSFVIVVVLPLDISETTYRHCTTHNETNTTCTPPNSYVGEDVLTNLWRVVYWTSQGLTWLLLPLTQSYSQAGEFTIKGKIKSALLDNAIYYGLYLFICSILLIYLATHTTDNLDWNKLKAIASSASNSWGLFLLVFMLGHGLISLPQTLWYKSTKGYTLNHHYFRMAVLSQERNQAEESLEDCVDTLHAVMTSSNASRWQFHITQIEQFVPTEFRERMRRRRTTTDLTAIDEKSLIKLHRQIKKSLQNYNRTEHQWQDQIDSTVLAEDVEKNCISGGSFIHSIPNKQWRWPKLEYFYRCTLQTHLLKVTSLFCATLSLIVIWSEATFFVKSPVLSIFAAFLQSASYNYFTIELLSTLSIMYMAVCAFYTIFKIRVFNFYYLAGGHMTDEWSLIFSGMLISRLTPPLCLNVISLFHLDSHVVQVDDETSYTKIMGHMDVLSLISDGFNIYFPVGILIIALLTWFKVGARVLGVVGVHQFLNREDEISVDLVQEGVHLVQREKRRRQRSEGVQPNRLNDRQDADRGVNVERSSGASVSRSYGSQPPRDLFDDV